MYISFYIYIYFHILIYIHIYIYIYTLHIPPLGPSLRLRPDSRRECDRGPYRGYSLIRNRPPSVPTYDPRHMLL